MNYRLETHGGKVAISSPEEALAFIKVYYPETKIDEAANKSEKVISDWKSQIAIEDQERQLTNGLINGAIPHDFEVVSFVPKNTMIYRHDVAVSLVHKRMWKTSEDAMHMVDDDFFAKTEQEFDEKWDFFLNWKFFKLKENQFVLTPLEFKARLVAGIDRYLDEEKLSFETSVFPREWREKMVLSSFPYCYGLPMDKISDDEIKRLEGKTKQVFTSIPDISEIKHKFLKSQQRIAKLYLEKEKREEEIEARLEKRRELQEKIRRDRKLAEITRSRISPPQTKFFSMAAVASAVNKQRK